MTRIFFYLFFIIIIFFIDIINLSETNFEHIQIFASVHFIIHVTLNNFEGKTDLHIIRGGLSVFTCRLSDLGLDCCLAVAVVIVVMEVRGGRLMDWCVGLGGVLAGKVTKKHPRK